MLNPELWATGGTTMAVGMGIVFSFLVVMVFAMMILTRVVAWLNKVCPVAVAEVKQIKKAITDDNVNIAIAIATAMKAMKK